MCRIPYENVSRTGPRNLCIIRINRMNRNNLDEHDKWWSINGEFTYDILLWKWSTLSFQINSNNKQCVAFFPSYNFTPFMFNVIRICLKMCRDKGVLNKHERSHMGLKAFPCEKCGKYLGTAYALKMHLKTHAPGRRNEL